MSIRDDENALFRKWEKRHEDFVADGVVSEKDYRKADPKIVFILKEVNDEDGRCWDLRDFLKKGAPGGADTWGNVARWAHAIRKQGAKFDEEIYEEGTSVGFRRDALKRICAINLKKTPGGSKTNQKRLRNAVEDDNDFIAEQYELYRPDLTICAGEDVGKLFLREVISPDGRVRETKNGWRWCQVDGEKCLIFRHPNRAPTSFTRELVDAVNEIMPA